MNAPAARPGEPRAHCTDHDEYRGDCPGCVDADMIRVGARRCNHTIEEGCTGHGDF